MRSSKMLWGLISLCLMPRRCARPGMFPHAAGLGVECPGASGWAPTWLYRGRDPLAERGRRGARPSRSSLFHVNLHQALAWPATGWNMAEATYLSPSFFAYQTIGCRGEIQRHALAWAGCVCSRSDEAPSQVSEPKVCFGDSNAILAPLSLSPFHDHGFLPSRCFGARSRNMPKPYVSLDSTFDL